MLHTYLTQVTNTTIQGDAREESYYSHLSELVKSFAENINRKNIHITTLPKKTEAGNPDFRIWDGQQNIIGYIEAKTPGTNLDRIETSEQLKRYRDTFPNLLLTDFYEFRFYRNGKLMDKTFIGRPFISHKLKTVPPVENETKFSELLDKFLSFSLPKVYSAETLAVELAKRTRFLKDEVVQQELLDEETNENHIIGFYEAFQKFLISGLTKEEFADLYAQTVAYGLFIARTRTDGIFNRQLAYNFIPATIGILRDVFQFISLGKLTLQMQVIVDDIAAVLNTADIAAIFTDYYKKGKGEDPIIHFYETFLEKYDPDTREQRGVYYTPEPVVDYIVGSVNEILKRDFSKIDGFASTDVTVLDPAGGTLTFLAQAAKSAIGIFCDKYGEGNKQAFISEHVLAHFYAFELMMAPYAIAHLKMSFVMEEFGYKLKDNERFKLYLTNTLEVEDLQQTKIPGMASLSEESHQATLVKKQQPVLAIIGNPPYSVASYNKSAFIDDLMSLYKEDVKNEKLIAILHDDYAKFIRFCHWKIEEAGRGVFSLITKNTYLNTSAFKGLRKQLLLSFDNVYVLDLHGKLYEKTPDGNADQNVFDIRVGTAIIMCVKTGEKSADEMGNLYFAELYGDRDFKYDYLSTHTFLNIPFEKLDIDTEFFFFEKKQFNDPELYSKFFKLQDILISKNSGVKTGRDHFITDKDNLKLKNRLLSFLNSTLSLDMIKEVYGLNDGQSFKLQKVKKNFKLLDESLIVPYSFKPFENKYLYYDNLFVDRLGDNINANLLKDNLSLTVKKSSTKTTYDSIFITNNVTDLNFIGGQSYVFPLWIYEETKIFGKTRKSNFNSAFEKALESQYNQKDITEDIFYYIYAILYCPTYRQNFAGQLQTDYPKIPFTHDGKLFNKVSAVGKQLSGLHLLTSNELSNPPTKFMGKGNNRVSEIRFAPDEEKLYINDTQYFTNITTEIWEWEVGNNKPVQRWMKNNNDSELGLDQTIEFCKICTAVNLTFDYQCKIDEYYPLILENLLTKE